MMFQSKLKKNKFLIKGQSLSSSKSIETNTKKLSPELFSQIPLQNIFSNTKMNKPCYKLTDKW